MIVDETMLRACVDGELDAVTRQQVETALAHSADLQLQAEALRASCLPYGAAFETQAQGLPPLPENLRRQMQDLVAVAAAPAPPTRLALAVRQRRLGLGWAVATSFGLGLLLPWRPWVAAPDLPASAGEPWVQAIADYQALYVRETVGLQSDSPARLLALLGGFDQHQRAAMFVPDLSGAGLQFRRVQRLGFGSTPLIQMVFLPTRGRPAALCVLPMQRPDVAPSLRRVAGLAVVSWTRSDLALVLVADMDDADALVLASGLFEGRYAPALG